MKNNGEIDKWEVALKEVQAFHETPLRFPDEINLHTEHKDVVPTIHRTVHDWRELERLNCSPNGGTDRWNTDESVLSRNAKYNTGRKLTFITLPRDNRTHQKWGRDLSAIIANYSRVGAIARAMIGNGGKSRWQDESRVWWLRSMVT